MADCRIFISSTTLDMGVYRDKVVGAIEKLDGSHPVHMQAFSTSGEDAKDLSYEYLDTCHAFIGIVGHRYGTIIEGETRSVIELEYERAIARDIPVFIFLASDEVTLRSSQQESDSHREHLQRFRHKLERHAPEPFSSPDGLAMTVLACVRNRILSGAQEVSPIFSEGDAATVFGDADGVANKRRATINELLGFMAQKFSVLFSLDQELEIHPFFSEVTAQLKPLVPGVTVDEHTGILKRANIRHVILRTATLLEFVRLLKAPQLRDCGKTIGANAARDLVKNTLEARGRVPDSPRAFLELWDYWDSTGGWGKLELSADPEGDESEEPEWTVSVHNSFLMVEDDEHETNRLGSFWAGYIHGFLETALPEVSRMISELSELQRKGVALPAYLDVEAVEHVPGPPIDRDQFRVRFRRGRYSHSLRRAGNARRRLLKGEFEEAVGLCDSAISAAIEAYGGQDAFHARMSSELGEEDAKILDKMRRDSEATEAFATEALQLVNRILGELAQAPADEDAK